VKNRLRFRMPLNRFRMPSNLFRTPLNRFRMPTNRLRLSLNRKSLQDKASILQRGVVVVAVLALVVALLSAIPLLRRGNGPDGAAPPAVKEGPLPERNTATSTTRQNKDGSLTTTVHTAPVNYRAQDGSFQPIDSKLQPAAQDGYAWRNGANRFGLRFKDSTDADFTEVRIGDRTFRMTAQGAAKQKARVDGSRITYASAYPGADLTYTVIPTGVKEVIELAGPDAPDTYVFRLSADDRGPAPVVRSRADGAYEVSVAPVPGPVFVIQPPVVQESPLDGDVAAPALDAKPQLLVEQSGRDIVVTLRLDGQWLRAPGRRFPVYYDPTMTIQPNVEDTTFASSGFRFNSGGIFIGSDTTHWRGAVQFDVSGLPVDAQITDAKLGLYFTTSCIVTVVGAPHCGGVDHVIDAHRMTSAWVPTGTVAFDSTASGTYTLPASQVGTAQWMTWPLTALVRGWATGTLSNYGLLLKRRTEVVNSSGPVPPGIHGTAAPTQLPKLDITYTSDAVSMAEPATLHSNGADLAWSQYTGPSGAPFDRYEVHRAPGSNIFTPSAATLLATFKDRGTITYRDTTAAPDKTFTYRVVANGSASNQRTVILPPAGTARKVLQPGSAEARNVPIGFWPNLTNCANYGANSVGTVGARAEYKFRTAVYFDLRDIPAGATIANATATFNRQWGPTNSIRVQAHRITRPWSEGIGNSDDGVECSGGATWYDADTGQNWTAQGGDIDQNPAAYLDITGGASPQLHDFNLTGLVQSWVSGTASNNGFMLRTADETLRAGSEVAYATDDFTSDITQRPKLTVTYSDGSVVHAPQASLSAPGPGSVVTGTSVRLAAAASDDRRVELVEFLVDGQPVGQDNSAPYEITWNSTGAARGIRSVTVRATDDAGNQTTSAAVSVNVDNSAPPSGSITAPAPNATITGPVTLSANPLDDVGVASVAFLIDGVQVGKPITSSPWSMPWDPSNALAPSFNGAHLLTAAITDTSGQVTVVPATAQSLTVNTTGTTTYKATLTLNVRNDPTDDVFPQAMVENTASGVPIQDPTGGTVPPEGVPAGGTLNRSLLSTPQNDGGTPPQGCPANAYCPMVNVTNNSGVSWSSSPVQIWYRWYAPNGAILFEGRSLTAFPNSFSKTATASFPLTIYPPALPPGSAQGTFRLRIDLYDPTTNTWFSAKGNPPIDNPVLVAKALSTKLGLERYYQYDGAPLGAGMSTLNNLANGDMLVRWTPFFAPGRGLSSMVDLTYNSLEDHSSSPAGNNFSLSISGLSRLGEPIDIHPNKADIISGRTTSRFVEITDGDGTTHHFDGVMGTDGVVRWTEPPGVNLYLRSLPPGDINRVWALTRPDKVTYFYDEDGFPTSVEDRNGNRITYTYQDTPSGEDPGGPKKRIITVTDAGGRQFTIEYYSKAEAKKAHVRGNIKQIKDHSGTRLKFFYYDDGNLLRLTEVGGTPTQEGGVNADGSFLAPRSFTFTYTTNKGDGPAIGTDDAAGKTARLTPDVKTANQSTRLYSVIDPRENETRFAYFRANEDNPLNRWKLKSRTDRGGQTTSYAYDPATRVATVTAPMGRITRYSYDTSGRVTSIVNPKNETTGVQWNTDNKVSQVTNESATPQRVTSYTYNNNGYMLTRVDELLRRTELTYYESAVDTNDTGNHLSLLKTVTSPEGTATAMPTNDFQWLFEYDTPGNPHIVTDPTGGKTVYDYNQPGTPNAGTLSAVHDANGNPPTTFPTYDPSGQASKVVDPLNNILQVGYDLDGNVIWTQDPNHFSYTGTGVTERSFKSFFDYDSFGRLGRQSAPRSTANLPGQVLWSSVDFDANDNSVRSMAAHDGTIDSDPDNGPLTTAVFDTMDRPTLLTGPDTSADLLGERTGISYDAAGRTLTVTKPRGMQTGGPVDDFFTQYGYDPLDRVISQTEYGTDKTAAQTHLTQMCYDKAGDLRSVTSPRAGLTPITCPGDGPYTGTFTTRMDFDLAHQMTFKYDPLGHKQKITRDRDGNVKTVEGDIDTGRTSFVQLGYDQSDRPTSVQERFDSTGRMLTTRIEYDKNGNKIRLISPRASDKGRPSGPYDQYVTVNSYDALNRLVKTQLPFDTRDGSERQYVHSSYDPNGNLRWSSLPTTQSDPNLVGAGAKTEMSYFDPGWIRTSDDPANPLVHFDYTAQGWQKERTPELMNAPGTLDTEHRMTWDYFLDGKTKSRNNRMGHPITFTYDADNNQITANATGGVTGGGERPIETQSTFDGFDQISKTRSRKSGDTSWTFTTYTYDVNGNVKVRLENGQENDAGNTTTKDPRRYELTYDDADWLIEQRDLGVDALCKDDSRIVNTYWANGLEKQRDTYRAGATCTSSVSTWPKKQTTTWSHADNGKLKQLTTTNGSGAVTESHTVGYFDDSDIYVNGNRATDNYVLTRGTGSGATTCVAGNPCNAKYVYDARDRLVRHEPRAGKSTDYKFDEPGLLVGDTTVRAGNVTTQISNGLTTTQRYKGGQLVDVASNGVVNSKYWYDEWGNIDCITTSGGSAANCNPATGTAASANLLTDYHHDQLNRLDGLRQYASGAQTDATTYVLDAMDRVTSEVEDHTSTGNDRTTTFTYQGLSSLMTEEKQAGGADPKTKTYSYDNFGHRLGMIDTNAAGTANTYSYGGDVHGSISQLIDDAGSVKASYGYTPYGGADAPSTDGEALTSGDTDSLKPLNPMRFSGKRADSGTASSSTSQPDYDMGSRRFGPGTGRFLQQDAYAGALSDLGLAMDPLTQNRYALAGGNPISYIETDGHMLAAADGGGGGSTGAAPPPPPPAPSDQEKKPSAAERFFKTAGSDIWNSLKSGGNLVKDSFRCEYTDNQTGCDELNDQLKHQYTTKEGWKETWNAVKEPFVKDCTSMERAPECGGHIASTLVEALAGKGAGRLGRLAGRSGDHTPDRLPDACKNSFSPDTPVVMADGTTKKIKDIKVGDKVLATDPKTGKTSARTVTTLHVNQDNELTDLSVRTPDGRTTVLNTTQHHPFWDDTTHSWVDAGQLLPGHRLRHASGAAGTMLTGIVTVVAVSNFTGFEQMNNLTVAVDHTYYVLANGAPVLVHNCGDTPEGVDCTCFPATGAGPNVPPIRVQGPWTRGDIGRGAHGLRPNHLGDRLEIHHADQMPGAPIHELDQVVHRGPGSQLHPNPHNQGVTPDMRTADTQLHWWYRSQEQGWGYYEPDLWYDNWPG